MFAQLVPADGSEPIVIDKDVMIVGRQAEHCDIVLSRKSVSKIHCIIAKTDGLLFVRDLDSTNGTKVNGQRIVRGALLPGDQLAFAGEKFKVHMGPSQSGAPPRSTERTQEIEISENPSVPDEFADVSMPSIMDDVPPAREAEDLVE